MPVDKTEILALIKTIYPFYKKEEFILSEVIDQCEVVDFKEGQVIYDKDGEAESLFIVQEGQIELRRTREEEEKVVLRLNPGDFFGYEMLSDDAVYRSTAVASTEATLLIFNREALTTLADKYTWFNQGLHLMYDSHRLARRVRLNWVGPDEVVYFVSRRHTTFLFLKLLFPTLFLGFSLTSIIILFGLSINLLLPFIVTYIFILFGVFNLIWQYLDWTNDYSIITNKRVVFLEKVILLYDSRQEAPISAVLKVDTTTDFWGRWLGYGNVIASTYAGLIRLDRLNHPQEVAALLQAESERAYQQRRENEKKTLEKLIRQRIEPRQMPLPPQATREAPRSVRPGPLQISLANMFRMRFEDGPKITYRTHWFILLVKIFIPSLILVSLGLAFIFRLGNIITFLSEASFTALILMLFLLASLGWLYEYIDWRNDYYEVTLDQVVDVYKKPLGREEREAAPIKNIQSIEFKRLGIFGILLNYGTVYIRVGDAEMTFDRVFDPADVQRDLFRRIAERDYKEKQTALIGERERMADWIEVYHQVMEERQKPSDSSEIY